MTPTIKTHTKMERNGKIRILTFGGGTVRDIQNRLGRELDEMTDEFGDGHLLLDFTNVDSVGSEELGTIVALHKRLAQSGGRLTLFNLGPRVFEAFQITRLDTLVQVCREETVDSAQRFITPSKESNIETGDSIAADGSD
jgi:anti-anti-sigma factor